jgi:MFS family permease
MASVEVAGVPTIDAFSISIWSVVQQATQIGSMLILPWFADKFGRKPILWALCFAITADGLIGIFASNWRVFCAARFFAGLAAGLTQVGINTYASEVSPTNVRGAMITLYAISFAFGSFLANFVTYAISVSSPSSYRIAFYCEIGMVITFLPGALFAPESPCKPVSSVSK